MRDFCVSHQILQQSQYFCYLYFWEAYPNMTHVSSPSSLMYGGNGGTRDVCCIISLHWKPEELKSVSSELFLAGRVVFDHASSLGATFWYSMHFWPLGKGSPVSIDSLCYWRKLVWLSNAVCFLSNQHAGKWWLGKYWTRKYGVSGNQDVRSISGFS